MIDTLIWILVEVPGALFNWALGRASEDLSEQRESAERAKTAELYNASQKDTPTIRAARRPLGDE